MQAFSRDKTRRERYDGKKITSGCPPLSIVTVNFEYGNNIAFTIRTAVCYGVRNLYVIGSVPDRRILNPKSGSLYDYLNITSFSTPSAFLEYCRQRDMHIVSAELTDKSVSLFDYKFDLSRNICLALGNEMTGVPVELINEGDLIYIPMIGQGYCLNTAQAGTAIMTEYVRQFLRGGNHL
jgi:tRNA G18 (ribose-2'-O)-methylase SpoU